MAKTKVSAAAKAAGRKLMSPNALAQQKIRTNFSLLGPMETDSIVDAQGKTLRQRLLVDIERDRSNMRSVIWGVRTTTTACVWCMS